jgi:deazaflavin-dependent oxidoreductase (nitroreductase family)
VSFFKTTLPVGVYRLTRGRVFGRLGGQPVLLLETRGRRSRRSRTTPVQYMPEGESVVVVASNAGASRPPAWLLNLRAHPHARVQLGRKTHEVTASEASGERYSALWARLTAGNRQLEKAAHKAGRRLPILVLSPVERG